MHADAERAARGSLARVLATGISPEDLEPDADMAERYGLTSLNKVLFMMSVCDEAGVDLSCFTEHDIARLRTLREVADALAPHCGKAV
ncbi:acyl carrier protein [Peterkaempfera griseoplana]|uniref:acyl carrier protein n=1 Tax=Peterkaempfera griseoplana TaxID=66896 RepID=UPI0006E1FA8F|nr:acyl carrier protein [Peterkaempfera griseoplana]